VFTQRCKIDRSRARGFTMRRGGPDGRCGHHRPPPDSNARATQSCHRRCVCLKEVMVCLGRVRRGRPRRAHREGVSTAWASRCLYVAEPAAGPCRARGPMANRSPPACMLATEHTRAPSLPIVPPQRA
jgi:hypothetical protein